MESGDLGPLFIAGQGIEVSHRNLVHTKLQNLPSVFSFPSLPHALYHPCHARALYHLLDAARCARLPLGLLLRHDQRDGRAVRALRPAAGPVREGAEACGHARLPRRLAGRGAGPRLPGSHHARPEAAQGAHAGRGEGRGAGAVARRVQQARTAGSKQKPTPPCLHRAAVPPEQQLRRLRSDCASAPEASGTPCAARGTRSPRERRAVHGSQPSSLRPDGASPLSGAHPLRTPRPSVRAARRCCTCSTARSSSPPSLRAPRCCPSPPARPPRRARAPSRAQPSPAQRDNANEPLTPFCVAPAPPLTLSSSPTARR